jgi:hypothetical protein
LQRQAPKPKYSDKGKNLHIQKCISLFNTRKELEEAVSKLQKHFTHSGLIMHVGNSTTKSKSEVVYFPPSLSKANKLEEKGVIPTDISLPHNGERIGFTSHFKFLGSIIMLL